MAMMFPPPAPPAPAVVQHECRAVFDRVVQMAPQRVIDVYEKEQAEAKNTGGNKPSSDNPFAGKRKQAIDDAALSVGAQAGLHWRYAQIERLLHNRDISGVLDQTFRFNRLVTTDNVLYPVISEANQSFTSSSDGQSARSSRMTWNIIEPARIVTTTPNWRVYLEQPLSTSLSAPEGLMPYNADEQALWEADICRGFTQGAQQADLIFQDRMTRLVRDYSGMLRYKMLEAQNVVNPPKVMTGDLGTRITEGGDKVYIGDQMIRITGKVRFQNADKWQAIDSMALPKGAGGGQ